MCTRELRALADERRKDGYKSEVSKKTGVLTECKVRASLGMKYQITVVRLYLLLRRWVQWLMPVELAHRVSHHLIMYFIRDNCERQAMRSVIYALSDVSGAIRGEKRRSAVGIDICYPNRGYFR
jgi:hypothetical protein